MPWGNRSIVLRDPDGNLVNLFQPVTDDASVIAGKLEWIGHVALDHDHLAAVGAGDLIRGQRIIAAVGGEHRDALTTADGGRRSECRPCLSS